MKNLIRNVLRSFKNNKMSIIGLVFLLFFGLGAFCTMSNTTSNIKNEYNSISSQGKMHDLTAAELYEVGSAGYLPNTKGIGYNVALGTATDFKAYSVEDFIKIEGLSIDNLWSGETTAEKAGTYYIPIPDQELKEDKESPDLKTYTRTYHITLDSNLSTGLFSYFAQKNKGTRYTTFDFKVTKTYDTSKEDIPESVLKLDELLKGWKGSETSSELLENSAKNNVFALDYQAFTKFIADQTQTIYSTMTINDTPLAMYLDEKYSSELEHRYFKSLNVTATKDNIFYKIINSNAEDTIDTLVLFKDSVNRYGNNLFSVNDWAPYDSEIVIYNTKKEVYKSGQDFEDFKIPADFNDVATTELYSLSDISTKNWDEEKKFAYSQIIQIRFKRMLAGNRTTNKDSQKTDYLGQLLTTLAAKDKTKEEFNTLFYSDETVRNAYDEYLTTWKQNYSESITISANGNVVFSWVETLGTPQSCTLTNWTGRFSVVNPQHLSANSKRVIDPSMLNDFIPYRAWHKVMYGIEPTGEIDQSKAKQWLNTLTFEQFGFWINPNSDSRWTSMVYDNIPGATIEIKRGTGESQWNGINDDFISNCGGYNQVIWGCGITPDFMYPVVDLSRPTPNVKTEALVYCNNAGYNTIKLAFINSPVEEYLLARFKANVNTNRRQEILNDINAWAKANMIWPENVKSAYMANDDSNVLNCSAFRVAYIPSLVRTIDIVAIILCSFIGILAFVICFVIIKRYVERNRINIGIMRANGISKWKIALSLFPFALLPAIIGGLGAYIAGLLLQAPTLSLFKNYWTLPTPLIGFDWISLLVCIMAPFILFTLICFIATLIVLRTKSVELMKAGSEFKTNGFSRVVKKPFKYFGILTRFRVSLAFNSLSRLIMMALMSCLTMTSLVFAFTTFDKLNQSKAINSSQFDYSFSLKLTTPTASGSTYNTYDYSSFGITDPTQYLYNINWNTADPESVDYNKYSYPELTRWYSHNSIRDSAAEIIGNHGNLMLPSSADMTGQNVDLMYLADKTSSRLTLDYNLGASFIGATSNPWEIALALMPSNSRNLAADAFNNIVNLIGEGIAKATKTFNEAYPIEEGQTRDDIDKANEAKAKAGKWCYISNKGSYLYPDYYNGLSDFFSYDAETKTYSLTKHNWLTGFSDEFIYMLITAYTDKEIIRSEYPISYRQIPLNWDYDKAYVKKDELYTYIEASIDSLSSNAKIDNSHTINIEGIPENSRFIKLTNSNGENINSLLFDQNYLESQGINDKVNPIIINAFAAHKYKLSVGSTISITASNMVDRFDRKIHPEKFNDDSNKTTFKVVGISVGTNDEAFYTTQKRANDVLGLPNGESWNKTHRYMRWQAKPGLFSEEVPQLVDLAGIGADNQHITKYTFNSDDTISSPIVDTTTIERKNFNVPVGFNGIYTANKSGKPLTNGVSLYSYTGMYPGASVYKTKGNANKFAEILTNGANLGIANLMSGIDDPKYYTGCNEYIKGSIDKDTYLSQYVNPFINTIADIYGETTMITAICGAMDVAASDLIYTNLISTVNLAETSIMAIIIPITIIIVGIISNLIIADSKKMAAMLKALGYSDSKNLMSILAMFIPTIVFGLLLAIPLSFGVLKGYQAIIFTSANILVDITQVWWYYLAAVGGIGIILLAAYAIGYASLKRDRLVDQIK